MSSADLKPLKWVPTPGIGYTVTRRADGGMNVVFSDISHKTLEHWREFALEHLLDSDRLTRNLYDLRQVESLPHEAVQYALEVNTDPSVRNIRLAVVVANAQVREMIEQIAALSSPGGVEMAIFSEIGEAEAWLARPLTQVV
ncbi:MAG: hypothetical protein AB1894_10275 [Chloroflexota bacterium]